MPYTRPYSGGFVDYPATTTPINSTALNTMDVGIKTANDQFQSVTTTERTALTPTVGQCVWDSTLKQLMVYMNAAGGNAWQPIGNALVCTSTTRPSTPFEGQVIRETDTNKELTYSGSAWVQTNTWGTTSGVTGVNNLIVPPICVLNTSTLTVANATTVDATFSTESVDTDSMHDTSTNTNRITVNTTGVYVVTGMVGFANSSSGRRLFQIRRNNSTAAGDLYTAEAAPVSTGESNLSLSFMISLTAGSDYLNLIIYQSSGGSMSNVTVNFSAAWIGRTS